MQELALALELRREASKQPIFGRSELVTIDVPSAPYVSELFERLDDRLSHGEAGIVGHRQSVEKPTLVKYLNALLK